MATIESALTLFAPQRFSDNYRSSAKPPHSIKLHDSTSLFFSSNASSFKTARLCLRLCSALQELPTTEKTPGPTQPTDNLTKLYVANLSWSLSPADIKGIFAQCGTVTDVEIIRNRKGRHMGYAFVTMDSGEEAQVAVDKFDTSELSGRIIRVELAKTFKKPPPPPPPLPPPPQSRYPRETRHVLYVSNLAWKARSTHLRQVFTENFKTPVSARVVFDSPAKRSAGYGFVSFLTKEDAEAAISNVDGKEIMGRPLRLSFSEKKDNEAGSEKEEDQIKDAGSEDEDQGSVAQPEES